MSNSVFVRYRKGMFLIASRLGEAARHTEEDARHEIQELKRLYGHEPGFVIHNTRMPEDVYRKLVG